MERVAKDRRGVAVGEVEEEKGHALLVRCNALRGQEELDEAGIARARVRGRGRLRRALLL